MDVRLTRRVNKLPGLGTALRRETRFMSEQQANDVLKRAIDNINTMDAVDTGNMRDSGEVRPAGDDRFRVVFPVEYALYVHEGHQTRGDTYVEGRPFLTTAIEQERPNLERSAREAVRRAVG